MLLDLAKSRKQRLPLSVPTATVTTYALQPDIDDLRIEERVTEEFMGAAPSAAGLVGSGLRRRPTFRVSPQSPLHCSLLRSASSHEVGLPKPASRGMAAAETCPGI